ncbi:hypothetical protein LIER_39204 [Lithospermum erythrorhizon]|uniref:Uncharacterized protein n=1 Tax=Lithospermum erythrorhizon TaxID=34254 RepID=A0AAV3QGK9_LITER
MPFFEPLAIVERRHVDETQDADVAGEKDQMVDIPIHQQQEADVTGKDAENDSPHADDVISTHSEALESRESGSSEGSKEGSGEESEEGSDSVDSSEEDNVNEEVVDRGRRGKGDRGGGRG